jgi:hypothetical protein
MKPTEQLGDLDQRSLTLWACDCAEAVLRLFEERYPEDDRPRKAIEAARAWVRAEIKVGEVRTAAFAAHAAARESDDPTATAAARAAGQAAGTAHVRGHARHAYDYALNALAIAEGEQAAASERSRFL